MPAVTSSAANFSWLKKVKWDENGLVPVIAQEVGSNDVLMFAWMNRDALARTVELGEAVYWSRSRKKLWHKGEESGHIQTVREIRLDCDEDVILLKIEQAGSIACHTGRHSCFFQKFDGDAKSGDWQVADPVLQDPETIYTNPKKNTP
ncbi:phosphoribosyl-AMP cyclohydrolase [Massilia sp. DJPM01]|uniref:phosphoribosyl-AMP cyclohydrolase n=1 Tax=Massilia sp. DJPM01 TaxID=3024404 RepID=UPI00259DADDE|nr:phosphoribosyl-AMP cyclohydrolase [Massilia sp. DJPM01]MDM5181376.1 phosphoribosyl-AMP cyclohydrolase [Massilia sp. DJPM01]